MKYNYNEETLLHSVGCNLQRFRSVLINGILSSSMAEDFGVDFAKNYEIDKQDPDYISCLKCSNIDFEELGNSYDIHTIRGINFIIEGKEYEDDRNKLFIHHDDEVLVKNIIENEYIKGIAINSKLQERLLNDKRIEIIPSNVTKFVFIKKCAYNYLKFLGDYGAKITKEESDYIKCCIISLQEINNAYAKEKNEIDRMELLCDYADTINDINTALRNLTYKTFSELGVYTLNDAVYYISNNIYPVYDIPKQTEKQRKR